MATVIDIYIKLIIAVLGFVAPTVTLLFPIFFKGIAIVREKLTTQENQFEELIEQELLIIDNSLASAVALGAVDASKVRQDFKKNRVKKQSQVTHQLRKSLHYFELKEQIKWIFIPLFLSLSYVMLYAVVKDNICSIFNLTEIQSVGKAIMLFHFIVITLLLIGQLLRLKLPKFNARLSEWQKKNSSDWVLVTTFFSAAFLVMFFYVKDNWLDSQDKHLKLHIEAFIFGISFLLFLFSIRRLWKIACTVIDAKPMLDEQDRNRSTPNVPQNAAAAQVSGQQSAGEAPEK